MGLGPRVLSLLVTSRKCRIGLAKFRSTEGQPNAVREHHLLLINFPEPRRMVLSLRTPPPSIRAISPEWHLPETQFSGPVK